MGKLDKDELILAYLSLGEHVGHGTDDDGREYDGYLMTIGEHEIIYRYRDTGDCFAAGEGDE